MALSLEEADARSVTAPMRELHFLRSKVKGHASGDEATTIRKGALSELGTYIKHFRALCAQCDDGFRTVAGQFKEFK